MLTVLELLKLPFMKKCAFVAGIGGAEKRKIKRINIIDTPDIANWMLGEELLLTTAYVMRDNPLSIKNLILELNDKNVSALGIKFGRFINSLPEEVLKTADEIEFPVFSLPMECSFSEIIQSILKILSNNSPDVVNLDKSQFTYEDYISSSFLEIMISGKGIEFILEHLKAILNIDIAFYDYKKQKFYITCENALFYENLIRVKPSRGSYEYHGFAISKEREHFGLIFIDYLKEKSIPLSWRSPINYAKTAILIYLQKEISIKQAELRNKDVFLQNIIFQSIHPDDDLTEKKTILGASFLPPYVVMLVDKDTIEKVPDHKESLGISPCPVILKEEVWSRLYHFLKIHYDRVHYTNITGRMAAIISLSPNRQQRMEKLEETLVKFKDNILKEYNYSISIAIGGIEEDLLNTSQSYKQAKYCLDFMKASGGNGSLYIWEKLGLMRLLISTMNRSSKQEFNYFIDRYLQHIKTLGDYDRMQYIETLDVLLKHGWNIKASAKYMHIHYNTLRYRLKSISRLVPYDLENPEIRNELYIAIKLYYLNKEHGFFS